MNFLLFKNELKGRKIFSLNDIRKIDPEFNKVQLNRWSKKNYIKRIKQGFYMFEDQNINREFLFLTANKIYWPSYVSLERALRFYDLIPEEIFQITSVSTKKTINFDTQVGNFNYRHISTGLFWGYRLKNNFLMAEPEKAILDYLYLSSHINRESDFLEMRINKDSFDQHIDMSKLQAYLGAFKNNLLSERIKILLKTIKNA